MKKAVSAKVKTESPILTFAFSDSYHSNKKGENYMIIDTKYGKIEGIDQESYMEYRGVPYAKPPIGKLRWKIGRASCRERV